MISQALTLARTSFAPPSLATEFKTSVFYPADPSRTARVQHRYQAENLVTRPGGRRAGSPYGVLSSFFRWTEGRREWRRTFFRGNDL